MHLHDGVKDEKSSTFASSCLFPFTRTIGKGANEMRIVRIRVEIILLRAVQEVFWESKGSSGRERGTRERERTVSNNQNTATTTARLTIQIVVHIAAAVVVLVVVHHETALALALLLLLVVLVVALALMLMLLLGSVVSVALIMTRIIVLSGARGDRRRMVRQSIREQLRLPLQVGEQ